MVTASDAPFRLRWFSTLVSARTAGTLLEVGCGNGQLLEMLALRCTKCVLHGIDRSPLQVHRAIARLSSLPEGVRPTVRECALEDAPKVFGSRSVQLLVAMNVNLFWTDPALAGSATRELLSSRGRVLLGFEPPTAHGRQALRKRVLDALPSAGFKVDSEWVPADAASGAFALSLRRA